MSGESAYHPTEEINGMYKKPFLLELMQTQHLCVPFEILKFLK